VLQDQLNFLLPDLCVGRGLALPENFFADRQCELVPAEAKVSGNLFVRARATEVQECSCHIHADVNLPVGVFNAAYTCAGLYERGKRCASYRTKRRARRIGALTSATARPTVDFSAFSQKS
jgi:hypothetical protein